MEGIHLFSESSCPQDEEIKQKIGIRGRRIFELAELKLPVAPGFTLDANFCKKYKDADLDAAIRHGIEHIQSTMGKTFGDPTNPLFIKVLSSSNMRLTGHYPSVHNVGLNKSTFDTLEAQGGKSFAYNERFWLLNNYATKLCDVDAAPFEKVLKAKTALTPRKLEDLEKLVPGNRTMSEDVYEQTRQIITAMIEKFSDPADPEDEFSILIQGMVYGNFSPQSLAGYCYTRNTINGEEGIYGKFIQNGFDVDEGGEDLSKLDDDLSKQLQDISLTLEDSFRELRFFKFTREDGKLWIVEQHSVEKKSTQATVKTLLSLKERGVLTSRDVIKDITPGQLNELLHPVIDVTSAGKVSSMEGGLAGSPGAASGRVYFSTEKLMKEHREAILRGDDSDVILCLVSSYAEDVKGIEIAQGVITAEGGYASHAPVVARSLGKVSLVNSELNLGKDKNGSPQFKLGSKTVREGDYITIDVPFYKDPVLYFGKVDLIKPDVEKNGLLEFMKVVDSAIDHDSFSIRANADLGRDATLARSFGAKGVGLCRTEHMFFAEERINLFRQMILARTEAERRRHLKKLEEMQHKDFYELFDSMHPHPVTIRLLDAPLHEFLPRTSAMFKAYTQYLNSKNIKYKADELKALIERMGEVNPMLGHRGCRVAITYPEIYEMQLRAIFRAAAKMKKNGKEVVPEIMIPIVMNEAELKFIKNGKKIEGKSIPGIAEIAAAISEKEGQQISFKTGTMVELPAAALNSDSLARYAEFFSYGTNDLTQTTFGLSRDDANSFFPVYTEYDLLKANPFQVLDGAVKELISVSAARGRLIRPDLKLGLCGEHGADPGNIKFCMDAGLNYVSCSPYNVPLAALATAQLNLNKDKG
jgi:pyruvate,orthophosphate dikinase